MRIIITLLISMLGNLLILDNYSEASTNIKNLVNSKKYGAHLNNGISYSVQGNDKKAIEEYTKAITDRNSDITYKAENYYFRSSSYYELKEYKKALADINKLISIGANNSYTFALRAELHSHRGKYQKALLDYDIAISLLKDETPLQATSLPPYYIGMYVEKVIQLDNEFNENNKGLLKSHTADIYRERGYINIQLNNFVQAITELNKALLLSPYDSTSYLNRGIAYFTLNQLDNALLDLNNAIDIDSTEDMFFRYRGNINEKLNNHIKAIEDYKYAYNLENSLSNIQNLVRIYSTGPVEFQKPIKAVALAQKWLVSSNNPRFMLTAATAFASKYDYSGAIKIAQDALEIAKVYKNVTLIADIERDLDLYRNKISKH
ncbi:MAG: hypothetical protein ACC707_15910 [Thiohalomonadales bacterium]